MRTFTEVVLPSYSYWREYVFVDIFLDGVKQDASVVGGATYGTASESAE